MFPQNKIESAHRTLKNWLKTANSFHASNTRVRIASKKMAEILHAPVREVCILFDGPMRSIVALVGGMPNFPNGGCGARGYLMRHCQHGRAAIPTLGNRGGRRHVKNYEGLAQKSRQFLALPRSIIIEALDAEADVRRKT